MLTYIPPAIAQLVHLRDLNIAQNRLSYLPSEMLSMRLQICTVTGNPFLHPPNTPDIVIPTPAATRAKKCLPGLLGLDSPRHIPAVSRTTVQQTIPSLSEICLRVLLAPHRPRTLALPGPVQSMRAASVGRHTRASGSAPSNLAALYTLPLQPDEWKLPAPHASVLLACAPDCVARRVELESRPSDPAPRARPETGKGKARADPGVGPCTPGVCPNPRHGQEHKKFYVHAEERMTWEKVVAGLHIPCEGGVPIRWRGCSRGCLDFLGDENSDDAIDQGSEHGEVPAVGTAGLGFSEVDFD